MARVLTLLFDLSHAGFVAALDSENRVLARRFRSATVRNDDVADWVEGCLAEAGGGYSSLKGILVGIGPGSFTGIRIAMAFAQGLAFPHGLTLHGFTSFSVLFLSAANQDTGTTLAIIPAGSGRFYVARGLEDAGVLLEADAVRIMGGQEKKMLVQEDSAAFDPVRSSFGDRVEVGNRVDLYSLARHAQNSGKGAHHPYYLQSPAAEIRLASP